MLNLHNITYRVAGGDILFAGISLTINNRDKIALIGHNGSGKSSLLKIIAERLDPDEGIVQADSSPYYVPQIFGQYDEITIAEALQIGNKLEALNQILTGYVTEHNLGILDDDWDVEERAREALNYWNIGQLDLLQKLGTLSGGQKTKVFLAGMLVHNPQLILLDEPSNHLDLKARELLYNFISTTNAALLVVSHDRKLLNLIDSVCELHRNGLAAYGGNYDFYAAQKDIEQNALAQNIEAKEKELRKAKEKERETIERKQKLDARGKKKQAKSGVARIMLNTLKDNAENSTSKIRDAHAEKVNGINTGLKELRASQRNIDSMREGFNNSHLHKGKIMFAAENINYRYSNSNLWKENLSFNIISGDRIVLRGHNGSGKTTLIKLISGQLEPAEGSTFRTNAALLHIDQEYSVVNSALSVYKQAEKFNTSGLQEHDIKIRLNSYLFSKNDWDKPCNKLSGGERMRLLLCCMTLNSEMPDIIILDEPTNNLDLQSLAILTASIRNYNGTLLVVSHDETFLQQIGIDKEISL